MVDGSPLPDRDAVLAALRGLPHDGHPMLTAAAELVALHRRRERGPVVAAAEVDRRRAHLVRTIDRWAVLATPVPACWAQVSRESVGSLVDRLAALSEAVFAVPDEFFYAEWRRLDALAHDYQELIEALRAGTHTLPAPAW
ncbi:hypothetical protein ACWEVD_21650 [Nocardia thailandica]